MEQVKNIADFGSLVVAWSAFAELITPLAALASLAWTGMRFYHWFKTKRRRSQK